MAFLPAAVLGAAGIQGATSLAGGKKGASAATQAARIQAATAQQGLDLQRAAFQINQGNLQPYMDYGTGGIDALRNFLAGPATSPIDTSLPRFTFQPTMADLAQTPGYQFQSQQARDAIVGQLTAQGRVGAPSAMAAGSAANQMAAGNWQNVYNAMLSSYQTNVNSLMQSRILQQQNYAQIANLLGGRVSTGYQAASSLAGIAANAANAGATSLGNIGAAGASGVVGAANALTGGLSGVGNAAGNAVGGLGQLAFIQAMQGGGNPAFNAPNYPGGYNPTTNPTGGLY